MTSERTDLRRRLHRRWRRAGVYSAALRGRLADVSRFVIVCPPRTGSTLLVSLLGSHPEIHGDGEILRAPVANPTAWLDGHAGRAARAGARAWGCKLITHQLQAAAPSGSAARFAARIQERRGVAVFLLRRRDWLLQSLSLVHAARAGYHFSRGEEVPDGPMEVDPVLLLATLHQVEQENEIAEEVAASVEHVELWYEDDLSAAERQERTVDRVSDTLGVSRAEVSSPLVPGQQPTLADRISNIDEVAELISRTRYARFLDPVPAGREVNERAAPNHHA